MMLSKDKSPLAEVNEAYDDLKAYEARIVEPLSFEHHGVTINVAGGLTAGPTLKRALELMGERTRGNGPPEGSFFAVVAQAMHQFRDLNVAGWS